MVWPPQKPLRVLGIETSCDETGIAIYDRERGLLAHALHSQIALHAEYGGVVPELASRDHVQKTLPLIRQVMDQAGCQAGDITGIAYTAGPGLAGALLVGAALGRSLAWAWNIPAVGIHHMEGHLLAPLMEHPAPEFPFVALLVSGGHTLLVAVHGLGEYAVIGETLDDAAGEAFDKTAKLLGLPYPGGPALARLATQGDPKRFRFPRPMTNRRGLDFSFSGLKTFAMNTLLEHNAGQSSDDDQLRADIARAFEDAVVDTLVIKCKRAMQHTRLSRLVIAGGVSANQSLRICLQREAQKADFAIYYPRPEFCTDNGAMIAFAGALRIAAGETQSNQFDVRPRWPIDALTTLGPV